KGDGYFMIEESIRETDGQPVFLGVNRYTRRGDFSLDRHGYLVNGSGYYLKGMEIDAATGNPKGSLPEVVKISTNFLDAKASTAITYKANLAAYPNTTNSDENTPGSELLDPAGFTSNPLVAGTGTVIASDEDNFLKSSLAGGAITVFDKTGAPVNVQFRWAKTDAKTLGGTHVDSWEMFYLSDSTATGASTKWTNAGQSYVFGANGQLSPAISSITLSNLTVNGNNLGAINLNHGSNGITQFADANGIVKTTDIYQDGYSSGELSNIAVSDRGRILGTFTNGQSLEMYEVPLASFNADNALQKLNGSALAETRESGTAIMGAQGTVVARAIEGSNADIADEFTKLIVTQQAYSASTRIITTGDQMLQEAINMKR
ncbi:MAG TPA: flagellar hook-basal body complex protein, partial [Rhodobacteraceae bacterium]|nr:flagellar hook-basal body complex protein [Paracoccaceae bacterium]